MDGDESIDEEAQPEAESDEEKSSDEELIPSDHPTQDKCAPIKYNDFEVNFCG